VLFKENGIVITPQLGPQVSGGDTS
jgi:hypothetical protein